MAASPAVTFIYVFTLFSLIWDCSLPLHWKCA